MCMYFALMTEATSKLVIYGNFYIIQLKVTGVVDKRDHVITSQQ